MLGRVGAAGEKVVEADAREGSRAGSCDSSPGGIEGSLTMAWSVPMRPACRRGVSASARSDGRDGDRRTQGWEVRINAGPKWQGGVDGDRF